MREFRWNLRAPPRRKPFGQGHGATQAPISPPPPPSPPVFEAKKVLLELLNGIEPEAESGEPEQRPRS